LVHVDERLFPDGYGRPIAVLWVPEGQVGIDPKPEMSGIFILGKFHEKGGIVPFLRGDLERVSVTRGQLNLWTQAQPKRNSSFPIPQLIFDVSRPFEKQKQRRLPAEEQRITKAALSASQLNRNVGWQPCRANP